MMKGVALAAGLIAVLAAYPSAAPARPKPAGSLCRAPGAVLSTCDIGTKRVSTCGQERGGAVYGFGRSSRVELETTGLRLAYRGWSGGGETQVYADTPTHRYIVYNQMVRAGFGADGHHDPKETSGLVVWSKGRTVSSRECSALPATFEQLTETLVPAGDYVPTERRRGEPVGRPPVRAARQRRAGDATTGPSNISVVGRKSASQSHRLQPQKRQAQASRIQQSHQA